MKCFYFEVDYTPITFLNVANKGEEQEYQGMAR